MLRVSVAWNVVAARCVPGRLVDCGTLSGNRENGGRIGLFPTCFGFIVELGTAAILTSGVILAEEVTP